MWRDFIFEKEKKRRNGTRRWNKKLEILFFLFITRWWRGEGGKCGSSGTPVTSTDRQQQDTRRVKYKHDRRGCPGYSRPAAKTQNLWANSISNNRKQNRQKRSTRCLRDFISLELTNFLLKVVAVVVVELSVGLCPTIISFVFLPEFRRLCWPERRPQPRLV